MSTVPCDNVAYGVASFVPLSSVTSLDLLLICRWVHKQQKKLCGTSMHPLLLCETHPCAWTIGEDYCVILSFRSPTLCKGILPTLLFEGCVVVLPLHCESILYESIFVES